MQEMLFFPKSSYINIVKEIKFCGFHLVYNLKLEPPNSCKFMQTVLHIMGDIIESWHGWIE